MFGTNLQAQKDMKGMDDFQPPPRRKVVGVFGDSRKPHTGLVEQIVPWIAQQGFHLLTGGRSGVMREASRVFQLARNEAGTSGLAIGILPDGREENEWVELLIRTHLPSGRHQDTFQDGRDPRSRNWIEVRTCDALVALPGGGGTEAEIQLAWAHGTPIILFGWDSSPLERLRIPTSALVQETRSAASVQSFILTHTAQPTTVGERRWTKTPSWPSNEHWPSPPPSTTRLGRHVKAPRANVYRALVDAQAVTTWMVPDGMTSHVHRFEPREGGSFRISLTYDEPTGTGKTTEHTDTYHGRFVKLVPGELVVQVMEFETDDDAMRGEMTVTFVLTEAGDGTDLLAVHDNVPPGVSPADNELGWNMSLDKLAALVEAG